MSTKALKGQLLAAIAMTLVAAVALGSSTFAWFAQNTTVNANAASISAVSDVPYLQIALASDGTYSTAVDLTNGAGENSQLKLVTPLNLTNASVSYYTLEADTNVLTSNTAFGSQDAIIWGTAYSSDPDNAQASNMTARVSALSQYVLHKTVYFKVTGPSSAYNLVLGTPKLAASSNSIANSYRILAVCGTNYMLYDKRTQSITGSTSLASQITTSPTMVDLFFYFDGTDADAKTASANDLSAIVANLTFTASTSAT